MSTSKIGDLDRPSDPQTVRRLDLVVEMRFGSHLYGTDTPHSDLDLKGVYLPEARDILLQRVQPTLVAPRTRPAGEKNAAGDIDRETYSLDRYFALLAEAQTVALEMLFAPDAVMTRPPAPLWREIQANAPRLVSRRAAIFVRYCRQQANKYGLKGARVAAARTVLELLRESEGRLGTTARLSRIGPALQALAADTEHVTLTDMPLPGGRMVMHLDVCGRRAPFTASIKTARETVQRLVEEYGARALQAETNAGTDWKALAHAVRVGREAIELFETGRLRFPLSCAPHLRRIRAGAIAYATVAAEIEALVTAVEAAEAASRLPPEPDRGFIDAFVEAAYRRKIGDAG